MHDEDLTARVGIVTIAIPIDGCGEVMLPVRGTREAFTAYCDEPVAKHTEVVVYEQRSSRSVLVTPMP